MLKILYLAFIGEKNFCMVKRFRHFGMYIVFFARQKSQQTN